MNPWTINKFDAVVDTVRVPVQTQRLRWVVGFFAERPLDFPNGCILSI